MAAGTKLLYEELHIGRRVFTTFDESEIVYGVIVNIEDIHNVEVHYDNGGAGIHCFDSNCSHYDPLYNS
jgi:hypothetical protein